MCRFVLESPLILLLPCIGLFLLGRIVDFLFTLSGKVFLTQLPNEVLQEALKGMGIEMFSMPGKLSLYASKRKGGIPVRSEKNPPVKTEDEERAFWAKHDSAEYVDWSKVRRAIFPNLKPSTKTISFVCRRR